MKTEILKKFENVYGSSEGVKVFFSPGRVNMIGEHTDYNGGHVFPCALTVGTYLAVKVRDDNKLRFYSDNIARVGISEVTLGNYEIEDKGYWYNYPLGIFWSLEQKGITIDKGLDMFFYGNIPNGAGLSSSASIEVVTAYMLRELFGFEMTLIEIAQLCQFSENNFNGMRCGIMDQFASAMGKKDNAIFLDTANLHYEYAPIVLDDKKIVIMNTNKKHKLGESKYNERRCESETALADLQKKLDIASLGELTEEEFEANKELIQNDICRKRAKHAVYENQRTIKAVQALKDNDIALFGKLMVDSHISLRDDYEVSCEELDILVEETLKEDGVWGVRMTGGGFGGCCVSIIDTDRVDTVIENVGAAYSKRVGYNADFYVVQIGDGPQLL